MADCVRGVQRLSGLEQNINVAFLAATTEGQQCLPAAEAPLEPILKLGLPLRLRPGR